MTLTGLSSTASASGTWTEAELAAAVRAYRRMLELELAGPEYSKTEFRREVLAGELADRSAGAFEYRMQNISAVLDELGLPWIDGYKPAANVGTATKGRLVDAMNDLWPEMGASPLAALAPPGTASVRRLDVGSVRSENYEVSAVVARTATQRERLLVLRYRDWLEAQLCEVSAHEYAGSLACDLFNESWNHLVEAKADSTRENARMAVGQLLDYRRFETADPALGAPCSRRSRRNRSWRTEGRGGGSHLAGGGLVH